MRRCVKQSYPKPPNTHDMNNWTAPPKPHHYVEQALVTAILDGTFAPGTTLPGERDLAAQLGVTRPTLREAIQRLARDGWLTVSHGRPTLVNNYWQEGGLNVLRTLVEHSQQLPKDFVPHLLEIRLHLAPAYTRAAVAQRPDEVVALLAESKQLADDPTAYATYDWRLQHQLTIWSGNPIYTLILNGFRDFYPAMAMRYFQPAIAREGSQAFYAVLSAAAAARDPDAAETAVRQVMEASIALWRGVESG